MRFSWSCLPILLTLPMTALAETPPEKYLITAGVIEGQFAKNQKIDTTCWTALDKDNKSKPIHAGCVDLVELEKQNAGRMIKDQAAIYEGTSGAPNLHIGEQSLEIIKAIGPQSKPVIDVKAIGDVKQYGTESLFIAKDSTGKHFIIKPKTLSPLPPAKIDADMNGIMGEFTSAEAASANKAWKPSCWTALDPANTLKRRYQRLDCLDSSELKKFNSWDLKYRIVDGSLEVEHPKISGFQMVHAALGKTASVNPLHLVQLQDALPDLVLVVGNASTPGVFNIVGADSLSPEPVEPPPPPPWTANQCKNEAAKAGKTDAEALVCIDLVNGMRVVNAPARNVLRPNAAVMVLVRYTGKTAPVMELSGNRGLTIPSTADRKPASVDERGAETTSISIMRFGPRTAGSVTLTVKASAADTTPVTTLELEVEQRFWGAIRFGLGTLGGDFREYRGITPAGSQTAIIEESRVPLQFELVTGFAPYLEALTKEGGRGYAGTKGSNWHVAPFIGFGVIGQSTTGIAALTSVHLGIELEFTRDFSLALTYVARRTRTLSNGYAPGSPITIGASEDSYTSAGIVSGVGLVLNASPSFLQFATGTSTAEKK